MKSFSLILASSLVAADPACLWAQSQPPDQNCQLVAAWANQAFHISHTIGLEEEKWTIVEAEYPADVYAVIKQIKHEAYHDLAALRKRVETVCAEKEGT